MDENNDQNNQKSKASNLNTNVSTEPMNTQAENDFCSVPILQKVLVPAPGYQSRLYSVQVMRASDAEDYYRKIPGNSNHDIAAPNERERSPTRDSKSINKCWDPLDFKEFSQYKA